MVSISQKLLVMNWAESRLMCETDSHHAELVPISALSILTNI